MQEYVLKIAIDLYHMLQVSVAVSIVVMVGKVDMTLSLRCKSRKQYGLQTPELLRIRLKLDKYDIIK